MKNPGPYRYVGPAELQDQLPSTEAATAGSHAVLDRWLAGRTRDELDEPFTFVVALDGSLRLAPRRSEHVALAAGRDLLAAGEMMFAGTAGARHVLEVTNQSTGYCPDPDCWAAVAAALDRLGLKHPRGFTTKLVFRQCPYCGERNIVRDSDFTCALCNGGLPTCWNFAAA
ncbi:TFIIB-type zinc ribbon-containing protein [Actinoplanes sp. L3-i22]|uniref:TFIIB-type zinc ribbon-containing protein n=1 Tax=Actinoplanes sp. L3-i22 TaxID=2836373 RepID=UPI001C84529C|nr:TFIIB-type zinc ribbon-containing protein [Actinoplanes sp. L3-i22]